MYVNGVLKLGSELLGNVCFEIAVTIKWEARPPLHCTFEHYWNYIAFRLVLRSCSANAFVFTWKLLTFCNVNERNDMLRNYIYFKQYMQNICPCSISKMYIFWKKPSAIYCFLSFNPVISDRYVVCLYSYGRLKQF